MVYCNYDDVSYGEIHGKIDHVGNYKRRGGPDKLGAEYVGGGGARLLD